MKEIGADIIIQRGDKLLLVQQRKAVAHGLMGYAWFTLSQLEGLH